MSHRNRIEGPSGKVARAGSAGLPLLAATAALALLAAYGLESGRQARGQGLGIPSYRPPPTVYRPPPTVYRPPPTVYRPPPTVYRPPPTPQYHQRMERAVNKFTDQSLQRASQMQQQATMRHEQQRAREQEPLTLPGRRTPYQPVVPGPIIIDNFRPIIPQDPQPAWQQPQPAAPLIQVSTGDTVVTTGWAPLKRGTKTLLTVEAETQLYVTGVRGDWAGFHVWQNGQRYSGWIHTRHLKPAYEYAPAAPAAFWDPAPPAPAETVTEPSRYALVTCQNLSSFEITYSYSWDDEEWETYTLDPDEGVLHWYTYAGLNGVSPPVMHITFDVDGSPEVDLHTRVLHAKVASSKDEESATVCRFVGQGQGTQIVLE